MADTNKLCWISAIDTSAKFMYSCCEGIPNKGKSEHLGKKNWLMPHVEIAFLRFVQQRVLIAHTHTTQKKKDSGPKEDTPSSRVYVTFPGLARWVLRTEGYSIVNHANCWHAWRFRDSQIQKCYCLKANFYHLGVLLAALVAKNRDSSACFFSLVITHAA